MLGVRPESFALGKADGVRFEGIIKVVESLGRETLLISGKARIAKWRKRLFAFMSRNAQSASVFFRVPPDHVVELGSQLEI